MYFPVSVKEIIAITISPGQPPSNPKGWPDGKFKDKGKKVETRSIFPWIKVFLKHFTPT